MIRPHNGNEMRRASDRIKPLNQIGFPTAGVSWGECYRGQGTVMNEDNMKKIEKQSCEISSVRQMMICRSRFGALNALLDSRFDSIERIELEPSLPKYGG